MLSHTAFFPVTAARPVGLFTRPDEARFVVQDFVAFPESLEWKLGQAYLSARGSKSFIHDARPIPYAINNDSTLSGNAAELLFQSLVAADAAGSLQPDIFVLELGIGVGLFARFFLDAFRERCAVEGKG